MIALAISAIGLASLVAAVGGGLNNAKLADQYIEAVRRAQSHLAEVGVTTLVQPGDQWGDDGAGYTWRIRISPPTTHGDVAPGDDVPPGLYTVEVIVGWQSGGRARSVTLRSQRMAHPVGSDDG